MRDKPEHCRSHENKIIHSISLISLSLNLLLLLFFAFSIFVCCKVIWRGETCRPLSKDNRIHSTFIWHTAVTRSSHSVTVMLNIDKNWNATSNTSSLTTQRQWHNSPSTHLEHIHNTQLSQGHNTCYIYRTFEIFKVFLMPPCYYITTGLVSCAQIGGRWEKCKTYLSQ